MTKRPNAAQLVSLEPAQWPYLLKLNEVAAILRCCTKTVRRLIDRGKLPGVRTGSQLRIRRPDLEQYLEFGSLGGGHGRIGNA